MLGLRKMYRRLVGRPETNPPPRPAEWHRLAVLPKLECDLSALGVFSEQWLTETFTDDRLAADWNEDSIRLAATDFPEMTHGANPGDRRALYYLVRRTRPHSILEIGTHIGSSTLSITLAAARNRIEGDDTRIVSADIRDVNDPVGQPWLDFGSTASPRSLVEAVGCSEFVRFEVSSSLAALAQTNRKFGLIFLDGNHDADTVYQEIPLALRRLESPGVIVLHDYFPGGRPLWTGQEPILGPQIAVERLVAERNGLRAVPLGDLPWPTKLGSHRTSLAIL
jgi:predicted O-methyltransferase YrrM